MKRLLSIIPLLLWASAAFGQGAGYTAGPYTTPTAVYICSYPSSGSPCSNTATIYTTAAMTVTITQPVQLAAAATFTFFAPAGQYVLQAPGQSYQAPIFLVPPSSGSMVYVTTTYTNATTTFSNVTGLSFPVAASTNYHAVCRITWQGSATTTGPKYQWTGPASPTAVAASINSIVTASTFTTASAVAFSSAMANAGTITATTNFTDIVDLGLINGTTAGTLQLQAAANGVGTLTIQPGSWCSVQ